MCSSEWFKPADQQCRTDWYSFTAHHSLPDMDVPVSKIMQRSWFSELTTTASVIPYERAGFRCIWSLSWLLPYLRHKIGFWMWNGVKLGYVKIACHVLSCQKKQICFLPVRYLILYLKGKKWGKPYILRNAWIAIHSIQCSVGVGVIDYLLQEGWTIPAPS